MFVCPICRREFETEEAVTKCYLKCWREANVNHKAKEAPRSADLFERTVNFEVQSFFDLMKGSK